MLGNCKKPLRLLGILVRSRRTDRDIGVTFVYIGVTSPTGRRTYGGNQHDIKKEEVGCSSRSRSRGVGNGNHHPGRWRQAGRIEGGR